MKKDLICPLCKDAIAVFSERATMSIEKVCKKCKVLVIYEPTLNKTRTDRVPERTSSCAMRFY